MNINIFSYREAKARIKNDPHCRKNWISVRDIGYEYVYEDLDKFCENVLVLRFDDVTRFNVERELLHPFYKEAGKFRDLVFFSSDMADQIVNFVESLKEPFLNIHCWAGLSRSQAIGFCLNTYFNLYKENNREEYERYLKNNTNKFLGNYDVIRILTERLYDI